MNEPQTNLSKPLPLLGWRELVSLPNLNIDCIKAKIDTGARSSAIHAYYIQQYQNQGETMIHFQLYPDQSNTQHMIEAEAKLLEMRAVRNSGGVSQLRPVIETVVKLGNKTWWIELTLTNRDVMGFRMLLGRQALRNQFLIDPGKSFLQSTNSG